MDLSEREIDDGRSGGRPCEWQALIIIGYSVPRVPIFCYAQPGASVQRLAGWLFGRLATSRQPGRPLSGPHPLFDRLAGQTRSCIFPRRTPDTDRQYRPRAIKLHIAPTHGPIRFQILTKSNFSSMDPSINPEFPSAGNVKGEKNYYLS